MSHMGIQQAGARVDMQAWRLRRANACQLSCCRSGVLPADQDLVSWLRSRTQATILLVANKAERRKSNGSAGQSCIAHAAAGGVLQ